MPVDTSIYGQQQTFDPIARINNLIGLQQNALGLKAAQQQYQSRGALGQAYQQAIDPQTGDIDTNKLIKSVGSDPRLAWQTDSIVQGVLARQKAQAEVQNERLKYAAESNRAMNGMLTSLLSNPAATTDDYRAKINEAQARGYITPAQAAQNLKTIPEDSAARMQWAKQHLLENASTGERLKALYGDQQVINSGGQTTVLSPSSFTGQTNVLGTIQNTASPDARLPYQGMTQADRARTALQGADLVEVKNPDGSVSQVSRGALAGTGGVGQTAGGIVPVGLGPTPGAVKGQEVAGEGSASALTDLRKQVAQTGEQMFVLNQATRALDSGAKTGVGRDTINSTVNFLNSSLGTSINPEGVKNFEELKKYLVQNAIRESGNMGSGTDSKLAAAFSGSPNTSLSTLTNKEILEANKGLLKYRQAMATAADQQGVAPDKFTSWQSQFVKDVPVEAFVWSSLPESRRRQIAEKMSDAERVKFKQSLDWAKTNGLY